MSEGVIDDVNSPTDIAAENCRCGLAASRAHILPPQMQLLAHCIFLSGN